MMILAAIGIAFTPLVFAALGAWILCTVLHEFSHALIAYWGGDDTVREKGYLTLDPTRFIDPVFTLLIPAIILLMGGIPLPGASVMIDTSRLRSERWSAYVSAAGPACNFLVFLALCAVLHPIVGLVDPDRLQQPTWVHFLGALAMLNFIAVLFNLIPVPPLDGFGIIEHKLDAETRWKLRQPQVGFACVGVLMMVLWTVPGAFFPFVWMLAQVCDALGVPMHLLWEGYQFVMFDTPPGA
jgi:Zn-dependent protease